MTSHGQDAPLAPDDLFMGRPMYYDRQGNPIRHEEAYRLFADPQQKRVAEDQVAEAWVSTVHLMIDHSFGTGPPIIFETMIFGGPHDEWCDRYATEADAKAGHAHVVEALREGRDP